MISNLNNDAIKIITKIFFKELSTNTFAKFRAPACPEWSLFWTNFEPIFGQILRRKTKSYIDDRLGLSNAKFHEILLVTLKTVRNYRNMRLNKAACKQKFLSRVLCLYDSSLLDEKSS